MFGEPSKEGKQMTTQSVCAGAPSHGTVEWHSIDWAKCYGEVRRLQARIVKATQEGRWGKVNALQWLLTHSFSGKALAVRRVTENQGKNTPGVDHVTWPTPAAKSSAILSLRRHGYIPYPLRRVYIPKSNGKMRPLGIPTMKDRAMQALHLHALEPVAETTADRNSYGFRPERCTADAIGQCYLVLRQRTSPQWILEGDIKSCFDKISHEWLIANIPTDKAVLQKWLKAGFIEKHTLFPTDAGTPQGGNISPALANMALDGLEKEIRMNFNQPGKVHAVRYCDDFIITGVSKELLENEVKPLVEDFLATRGLMLSQEKTNITHIEQGFDFLGQNVRKYSGKLLIKPAKKNVKAFFQKVREIVKGHKTATQLKVIRELNPVIRGWANYHRHVVAKKAFHTMDHRIWQLLWRWAKRRHPNKGRCWIKAKYFKQTDKQRWAFQVITKDRMFNGQRVTTALLKASDTPIRRHVKIKAEVNPFDPQWETYFEERIARKMSANLRERKRLTTLWSQQRGRCPICNQRITTETGWHIHHIVRRFEGGKHILSNLLMVHPNCHRQIHSQRLEVVKPAPAKALRKA